MATNNFAWIPLEVIQDNRLTKRHIKVLIALYSYLNHKKTDTVRPSREKLSKRCGMPMTRVSEVTGQLVDLGWLVKTGKGGFSKATRYTITVPKIVTVTKTVTDTKTVTPTITKTVTGMGVTETVTGKELSKNYPLELKGGNKRFKPPTIDEVRAYCIDRGNSIDAEAFVDHYQTNGWIRGKTKIKDWQACVRTWEVAQRRRSKSSHVKAATLAMQGFDIDTGRAFDGLEQIEGLLN